MFVEHLSWVVPRSQRESALNVLAQLHHHMDASGGLIRALAGSDVYNPSNLVSLTFWKSWEDLARFLAGPKSAILNDYSGAGAERPKPHHFEVVWDWPQEEVDTVSGESHWAFYRFATERRHIEALLDGLRHYVPTLGSHDGFRCAGIWLDKNNDSLPGLATQWSGKEVPDLEFPEAIRSAASETVRSVARIKVTDPYHLGVV